MGLGSLLRLKYEIEIGLSMKVLFILGNGFDINLGLKTRYQDFYDFYSKSHSSNDSVMRLKNHISKNTDGYWSDLELALGEYTKEFKCTEDFDEVIDDIRLSLSSYLEKIENNFNNLSIEGKYFSDDLNNFEKYLIPSDQEKIYKFKKNFIENNWSTNIVAFNYTDIVERITKNLIDDIIGIHRSGSIERRNILNKKILHIHGLVNDGMVLGVNDLSQVSNTKLHNNIDIEESIVKSKCNEANGEHLSFRFFKKIEEADIICAFGLSFGDSDKMWWEKIGEKLKQDCRLVIFDRKYDVSKLQKHKLARLRREIKSNFLNQTGLEENIKDSISNKIFVGVNTAIFQKTISNPQEIAGTQQVGNPIIQNKY